MTTLTTNTPASLHLPRFAGLRAALRRRAEFARVYNELASLSDRDLADIGVSRPMIRQIAAEAAQAA